ncbi:hypothetical protein [Phenylobacterium sp.]|uniref:hypothetical protein n=1 Tax=Phenylobacterium sp. TaxID=1871053 RepID=UPI0025FCB5A6|nr:hypothetical protein [Phenylobacterium sp.]MCA6358103.1 hypothetical protein [Phenylobacterium sp.]
MSNDLEFLRHPLSGVDRDDLQRALISVGQSAADAFPKLIDDILGHLKACSPLYVLSTMASWGLKASVSEAGASPTSIMSNIQQHQVELLQALAMTLPPGDWGRGPSDPHRLTEIMDAIGKATDAFHHRRYLAMEQEHNPEERFIIGLQERMRVHTQVVRNWGYFSDVVQISTELYGALDNEFEAHHGFSPTDLIAVSRDLVKIIETRNSDRYQRLTKVFRGRTIAQFVKLYFKYFPELEGTPEEAMRAFPPSATLEQVKLTVLAHSDLKLLGIYTAPVAELATMSGRSEATVRKILQTVSMKPGSLMGQDFEHFFMGNPIWTAPLIDFGGEFLSAIPQSIFSHIHPMMRELFEAAGLKEQLERRRAEYLEWKLTQIVALTLPTARLIPSKKWQLDGVEYETDLIAVLDRVIMLFEAKSAALTPAGLRGAPERVRRHVRDLIVDPSVQSQRLTSVIWKAKEGDAGALEITNALGLDVTNVDTITRVSVTLDDFSVLSTAERELKEAGWVPADLPLAHTLNIADFGCVADLLSEPLFFIHYLSERSRIQKVTEILGDELDYLGLYLKTGFNLGGLEKGEYLVAISGMSGPIDHYYTSRDAGVAVPQPRPRMHPYFSKLLTELESRSFESWTTAGLDILRSASFDEQRQAVKGTERLRKSVQKNFRDPKHECCMVIIPPAGREAVLMFYVYNQAGAFKRDDTVSQLATEVLEQHGQPRCTVVGRKIEDWDRPYQFVIIASPRKEEVSA